HFRQEVAHRFTGADGLPTSAVQLIECAPDGVTRAFISGDCYQFRDGHWEVALRSPSEQNFVFPNSKGDRIEVPVPWRDVRQLLRYGATNFLTTTTNVFAVVDGKLSSLQWPGKFLPINQIALAPDGVLHVASGGGLFRQSARGWDAVEVGDSGGRGW